MSRINNVSIVSQDYITLSTERELFNLHVRLFHICSALYEGVATAISRMGLTLAETAVEAYFHAHPCRLRFENSSCKLSSLAKFL